MNKSPLVTRIRFSPLPRARFQVCVRSSFPPLQPAALNNLPLFSFSSKGGTTSYGINSTTYFFFETGQTPAIAIETADAAVGTVLCTLNGYYH
jgi:hypothetical protein